MFPLTLVDFSIANIHILQLKGRDADKLVYYVKKIGAVYAYTISNIEKIIHRKLTVCRHSSNKRLFHRNCALLTDFFLCWISTPPVVGN